MKTILILFFTFSFFELVAQVEAPTVVDTTGYATEEVYKEPSKESKAYNAYRDVIIEPPFSLTKIKKLIKGIKTNSEGDEKLSNSVFNGLSAKEKFTYCMIHPESYSQNCDAEAPMEDEQKKIFAYIPDSHYELDLSNRQEKFLKDNKDSVLAWIKEVATQKNRVGLNFKEAIISIKSKSIIPFLVDFYKKTKKDHDILTTLNLLMEYGKYKPFLNSTMREKLYGDNASWPRFLNLNKANVDLILKRAMDYYNAK